MDRTRARPITTNTERREIIIRDLGVWTFENSALVLIDYQKEMFEVIRSETDAALAELHVRLLAKTAKSLGMPIVLSTVGVKFGINRPTRAPIMPNSWSRGDRSGAR